jgi:hypothetical protein
MTKKRKTIGAGAAVAAAAAVLAANALATTSTSPTSVDFGQVPLGATVNQTVTYTMQADESPRTFEFDVDSNNGTASPYGRFSAGSSTCPSLIPAGVQSCQITVVFTAGTQAGSITGAMHIRDATHGIKKSVPLSASSVSTGVPTGPGGTAGKKCKKKAKKGSASAAKKKCKKKKK